MPRGLRLDAPGVLHHRNVERCLDSSVQLLDFGSVAGTHEPLQSIARHGEHVIEVRHARNRQPLSSAESHFRRELAHRSGYKGYHDAADGVEYSVAGQDHNGSSTGKCGQFSSPHFSPFHAWPAFHSLRFGNSPTSAVCVSATSSASRSVMAAEMRYCRMASSASARTSRPCFSARLRNSFSTPPGKSMLMRVVYPPESSTSTSTVGRQTPNQRVSRTKAMEATSLNSSVHCGHSALSNWDALRSAHLDAHAMRKRAS